MIKIVEVTTLPQRRVFVQFPTKMYKDVPQYIPNTYDDDLHDWDPKSNPAFEYCEARCWLAYKDDRPEPVGRIGAILNHRANEKWGTNRMRFSQVDFIDDPEVSDALFGTVEVWAREKGCAELQGPLGFTDLDREGMLVEGFDRRSCFFTYYNYPYYPEHLARLGFEKDADWIENLLFIPQDDATEEHWARLSKVVAKRAKVYEADVKHKLGFLPILPDVFRLVNLCYAPLYGTVELSQKQIDKYVGKFLPMVNPKLVSLIKRQDNDELVAFGVAAPSMAAALKKHDGKLLPFGWIDVLHALSKNDTADMLLIAVHPDYQGKGLNGMIMYKLLHGSRQMHLTVAETGPTLELNDKILAQWDRFEVEQHKRRRCFVKKL